MNENELKKLSNLIADVYSEYQKELTQFSLASYVAVLRNYDFKSVRDAFISYQIKPREFKRHPDVGDILQILEGDVETDAYESWSNLLQHGFESIKDDELALKALRDIGGYDRFRMRYEKDLVFLKKEFVRRYKTRADSKIMQKATIDNNLLGSDKKTAQISHISNFVKQSAINKG